MSEDKSKQAKLINAKCLLIKSNKIRFSILKQDAEQNNKNVAQIE